MTDDETSDRKIVNIHIILVNIYFPKITPTTSVELIHIMEKMVMKQTVTHKLDLIKIEHCMTKRKLET